MPSFRADVREISPYVPGRPISDVAADYGFDPADVVKLASNERPVPPLPEVLDAIARAAGEAHRYPDNEGRDLRARLAEVLDVSYDEVMIGAGSSELLRVVATATGGPGTSAVYAWPSFIVYRLASILAMTDRIEVPLDAEHGHDLDAMLAAIRPDTTLVYVCNPNNPTGTVRSADEIAAFVDEVPERVLVLVDEAYHEYVTDRSHSTALPLAIERPNVIVTRTFSKVHGLAALRVGYGVSAAANIVELRKAQAPFSVTALAQAAALESLDHLDDIDARASENAEGRAHIEAALDELGIEHVPSQANFVYFRLGAPTEVVTDAFLGHAVILRPFRGGWVRVSVGSEDEIRRFVDALATELARLR